MSLTRSLFEHYNRNVEDAAYYNAIKSPYFHKGMAIIATEAYGKVSKNHKYLLKLTEVYINVQTLPASNFTTVSVQNMRPNLKVSDAF